MTHRFQDDSKQTFILWEPLDDLPRPMYVDAVHDDYEGFRILLRSEIPTSPVLKIAFESYLSYRNTDESYLVKIWQSMPSENIGKNFFLVQNSAYIAFFHEMTENIYADWSVKHYAIYTISDCVDVISTVPPIVAWLE